MLMIRTRTILSLGLLLIACETTAQRAAPCFAFYDFETIDQFNGWDIGPFVEAQTPEGDATGVIVPAWEIGDAAAANANGYFPVPDVPNGNSFVQANDAAEPCNCGLSDVALTTPLFDFSGRSGIALEFRAFHPGSLGSGPAIVEARNGTDEWTVLDTIPPVLGTWQDLLLDLSAFDGAAEVSIRFRWSDGGGWSSGFAMDDMCLRERFTNDLSVERVFIGDPSTPAFDLTLQTMPYRQLPVEQFGGLLAFVEVMNRGTAVSQLNQIEVVLDWSGNEVEVLTVDGPGELQPGERASVRITSTWTPPSAGELLVTGRIPSTVSDDDEGDNSGQASITYTAAGWEADYGAMSVDNDVVESTEGGTGSFVLANRMEIVNPGSTAQGVSVRLGTSTNEGEEIRAILMDANYTFLDTSTRHVISQADMESTWNGASIHLPFSSSPVLTVGDHFVGIQHLVTGDDGHVEIAMGGIAPLGGSVRLEGLIFDVEYLNNAPLVRLHLSDVGVGTQELERSISTLSVYPSPTSGTVTIQLDAPDPGTLELECFAADGQLVHAEYGIAHTGPRELRMDVSHWKSGLYQVRLRGERWTRTGTLVVAR
jgi:hypothetical protein